MTNNENHRPLFKIEADGIDLKVFCVSGTPRIEMRVPSQNDPRAMKEIHTHFAYEVFFVAEGELELITEDYSKLYREAIVIIPPRIKHFSSPSTSESYCLLFSFDEKSPGGRLLAERIGDGVCELSMTEEISFYISRLAQKSEIASARSERECELLCSLIFSGITAKLLPGEKSTAPSRHAPSSHIGQIESFINTNIGKRITLSDVAASVYLSTKQISRIIEREYSCSFSELVADKRLARAEMLLKNTDMRIAEIAELTFPGAAAYFYVLFKKKYGTSPLKYRKEARIFE